MILKTSKNKELLYTKHICYAVLANAFDKQIKLEVCNRFKTTITLPYEK